MHIKKIFGSLILAAIYSYAGDVTPLGQTVGKSTIDNLKKSDCSITELGQNKYSQGKMFNAKPSCYDIQGLKEVLFIYNNSDVLEAVLLKFDNAQFNGILGSLKQKYKKKTKEDIPFVGNKFVQWEEDKVNIELSSPHMSFDMELLYITKALNAKFKGDVNTEAQQKKTKQTNQL